MPIYHFGRDFWMAFLVKIVLSKIAETVDFTAFLVLPSNQQKLTDLWKTSATAPSLSFRKTCG